MHLTAEGKNRAALLPPHTIGIIPASTKAGDASRRDGQWRAADRSCVPRCGHSSGSASGLGAAFVGGVDSKGSEKAKRGTEARDRRCLADLRTRLGLWNLGQCCWSAFPGNLAKLAHLRIREASNPQGPSEEKRPRRYRTRRGRLVERSRTEAQGNARNSPFGLRIVQCRHFPGRM
jgi:hypothetical protein